MTNERAKRERKAMFLRELLANGGHVSAACAKLKVARATLAKWRDEDEQFSADWAETIDICVETLEAEGRRRAMGYEEPIVYQGRIQGGWVDSAGKACDAATTGAVFVPTTVTRFDSTLLMFLLKGHRPEKYRDGPRAGNASQMSDAELDAVVQRFMARKLSVGAKDVAEPTDAVN